MKTLGDGRKTIPTVMKAKISALLIIICLLTVCCFQVSADDSPLPAPDWVQVTPNPDNTKTVTIITPTYMSDVVNYYEYSTDSGLTWTKLSDPMGGEFVFDTTTEFSLRYVYSGFRSPVHTVIVTITKNTFLTSDAGITLVIPFGSDIPSDVSLSIYEIVSGTDYNVASAYFGKHKSFSLFDVHIMRNNKVYNTDSAKTWMLPTGKFDIQYCKVYYIADDGTFTLLESAREMKVLLINTEKTGLFAVVEDKTYCKGDVNGDGLVTAADARLALRNSAGIQELFDKALTAADFNGDSTVTAADARLILRYSAKLDK